MSISFFRLLLLLVILVPPCYNLTLSTILSRRRILQQGGGFFLSTTIPFIATATATAATEIDDPRRSIFIQIKKKGDSLGVQIIDTKLRGVNVVVIQKVANTNKFPQLKEGMILKGYTNANELINRIQSGPYPISLEFINLAAGGDAFDDLGGTIVTPRDAFELAKQTEEINTSDDHVVVGNGVNKTPPPQSYSITTVSRPEEILCAIQSRRGDVLEIEYEAFYYPPSTNNNNKKVLYDASEFRGTGRPYQMVLGSGDMIPGVDQGLYDMCPGEVRVIEIPPILGYGKRARDAYRIPVDYKKLEWNAKLITIDSTIRQDNNNIPRQEREARALY